MLRGADSFAGVASSASARVPPSATKTLAAPTATVTPPISSVGHGNFSHARTSIRTRHPHVGRRPVLGVAARFDQRGHARVLVIALRVGSIQSQAFDAHVVRLALEREEEGLELVDG